MFTNQNGKLAVLAVPCCVFRGRRKTNDRPRPDWDLDCPAHRRPPRLVSKAAAMFPRRTFQLFASQLLLAALWSSSGAGSRPTLARSLLICYGCRNTSTRSCYGAGGVH